MRAWTLRLGGLTATVAIVLACAGGGASTSGLPDLPTPGCTYGAGVLPDGRLFVDSAGGVVTLDEGRWTKQDDLDNVIRVPWIGKVPVQVDADDTNPTEVLVQEGSSWTRLPPPPLGEVTSATSLQDGVIVLTGGRHAMTRPDAGPSLLAWSTPSRDAWSTSPLPEGILSDFAFGGRRGDGLVLVGDTVTAVQTSPSEEPRILPHPAGFEPTAGDRGYLEATAPVEDALQRAITGNQEVARHGVFDDDTGWRDVGVITDGRRCGAVFEADGIVYVAGGFAEGKGKLATVVRLP